MKDEKLENSGYEDKGCCGGHDHEHEDSCCGGENESCCGGEHEHDGCGCGCGCGCGEDGEVMIVDLENENGDIVPCEVVDEFTFEEQLFVLVQNPEDGSMYLFKVVGEGEEAELIVPDDEEFNKASAYYEQLMEEE